VGEPAAREGAGGVLLVDKPRGRSSHDVVGALRRALGTRAVGHAGTLDPMATGLLVALVGEATRLSPFLSGARKRYRARVRLGVGTDSLDADGRETARRPLDAPLREALAGAPPERPPATLARALEAERARREQVPPEVSALHVDGVRAYERARRGEALDLPARPVDVGEARLVGVDASDLEFPEIEIELEVSKGYYVRAFARDLGAALGAPAHLTALRRLASGGFSVDEALPLEPPSALAAALVPTARALRRAMAPAELTAEGARRARQGKALGPEHFLAAPPEGLSAWFVGDEIVAVGEARGGEARVVRGFPAPPPDRPTP
jgi:tRNA pseudouridine55 synthase